MLWTRFFIPTTKEAPAEATAPAHALAIRAGLIRPAGAGSVAYLPLGLKVLRKIEAVIREEMQAAGAIELRMAALQPLVWWQESGREAEMGDLLLRLGGEDWRRNTVLGATHEEAITDIARATVKSYKQLPLNFYQIQTKFRGEDRPRGGLLRLREFLMKDAYSFDADAAGLDVSYQKMYAAYSRILTRCGLPFTVVEAESGPMGGEASHEFVVLTEAGDDVISRSEDGAYAANIERAARQIPPLPPDPAPAQMQPLTEVHTPGCPGINAVCRALNIRPEQMIKTLVYRLARASGSRPEFLIACVRGDHDVNESKLRRFCRRSSLGDATLCPMETAAQEGFVIGYLGPHVCRRGDYMLVIDPDARAVANAVTGANRTDVHVTGFNWTRELPVDRLSEASVVDIRWVVEGDLAPSPPAMPGARQRFARGIEIGHIFKLGTRYSQAMTASFLDAVGRSQELVMGSYGIGLDRILAAAIEAHHDDDGIRFPMTIAPFEATIVAIDVREDGVILAAKRVHDELERAGVDVLLDNRDERAGVKFKDVDLIGIPIRITMGKKGLAEGTVELKPRGSKETERIGSDAVVEEVVRRVQAGRSAST